MIGFFFASRAISMSVLTVIAILHGSKYPFSIFNLSRTFALTILFPTQGLAKPPLCVSDSIQKFISWNMVYQILNRKSKALLACPNWLIWNMEPDLVTKLKNSFGFNPCRHAPLAQSGRLKAGAKAWMLRLDWFCW